MSLNIYNFNYNNRQKPYIAFSSKDNSLAKKQISLEEFGKVALNMLGLRHPATMEHSVRTSLYAEALAREHYKDESKVEDIKTAALLHDLGKIANRDAMFLAKRNKQDTKDQGKHPFLSQALLEDVKYFKDSGIAGMSGQHHNNIAEVSPEVEIIMLADAFDSMTKKKYADVHDPKSVGQALRELTEVNGFNPELVKKFEKLVNEGRLYEKVQEEVGKASVEFKTNYINQFNIRPLHPEFISDSVYRKSLADSLNKAEGTAFKPEHLKAVIGPNELKERLKKATPINFNPAYAESGQFNMNLHLHTTASDGSFEPDTLFKAVREQVKINRTKGNKEDFVVAITDHDTFEGVKKALKYIAEETSKDEHAFDGIKFMPGIEFRAQYNNPEFLKGRVDLEMISYSINPYDKKLAARVNRKNTPYEKIPEVKELIDNTKGSMIGIAHPIRIDFTDKVKKGVFKDTDKPNEAQALQAFLEDFKAMGGHAAEGNYQMDDSVLEWAKIMQDSPLNDRERLVADLCEKAGLLKSGGVDNHGSDLLKRK